MAPEEEPPDGQAARKEHTKEHPVSTREPEGEQLSDASGIHWHDDTAIDRTAQLIWTIATKGDDQ